MYERNYMMSSASTLTRNLNNFFFFNLGKICITKRSQNDCYFPAYCGSMREEIYSFMEINRTTNDEKHTRISSAKHNDHGNCFPSREGTWQHHRFQSLDSLTYSRLEKKEYRRSSLKIVRCTVYY